jgi:hypothetical protein
VIATRQVVQLPYLYARRYYTASRAAEKLCAAEMLLTADRKPQARVTIPQAAADADSADDVARVVL